MTYEETLHYLYTSIPVFQHSGASAYKPGLGTSIALDDYLGNPHKAYKTIHVHTDTFNSAERIVKKAKRSLSDIGNENCESDISLMANIVKIKIIKK